MQDGRCSSVNGKRQNTTTEQRVLLLMRKSLLSPHHPSWKTQGAATTTHKESLARNKLARPNKGAKCANVGQVRLAKKILI